MTLVGFGGHMDNLDLWMGGEEPHRFRPPHSLKPQ